MFEKYFGIYTNKIQKFTQNKICDFSKMTQKFILKFQKINKKILILEWKKSDGILAEVSMRL